MRPEETRGRNERIAAAAARHHFGRDVPVPFLCECSHAECQELLRMTLHLYREARAGGDFIVAPGHRVDAARIVRIKELCWLFQSDVA